MRRASGAWLRSCARTEGIYLFRHFQLERSRNNLFLDINAYTISFSAWPPLLNGCCLPFTVWSIWYQKYRIKTWCTLCVTTQGLLWLQFFCYLFGGWWSDIFPLRLSLFMMVAAYGATLMAVNRVMNFIKSR